MYEDIRAGDKRLESFFTFFNLRNARFEIFWTNCTYIYIHMCVRVYIQRVSSVSTRFSKFRKVR